VKSIGNRAFWNCKNLTSVTLQEGLESIGEWCFGFTAIKEITIPKSVKNIGNYAFSGYRKDGNCNRVLEKVVLQEGLETIGH
jgi:hypothetical protein